MLIIADQRLKMQGWNKRKTRKDNPEEQKKKKQVLQRRDSKRCVFYVQIQAAQTDSLWQFIG